jgi:hypothetical protein
MLWRKYSDLKYENGILINNEYAYQQDILSLRDSANYERGVYRMTIDQVKNSNDTLVQELEKVRKQLKIKDKYVSQMSISKTTVSIDTVIKLVRDTVLKDSCDFRLDITYNDQTKATVGRIKDSIYHSVDIQSSFHSFISTTVQYREKKFLKRLFCFK